MVKKLKKMVPVFVACIILCMPVCTKAAMKTLTLVMKEQKKSVSCKCPAAIVQGGAMIGGDGIDYSITFATGTTVYNVKRGYCKSGVNFSKTTCTSPTGWSEKLTLKESQHNASNPGIGWGRIDY